MNEHDSKNMARLLDDAGYQSVPTAKEADIVLFNTCTVREKSHHKGISEVGRAIKMKRHRPHIIVGMTGCVAQEERNHLFEIYPELDLVLGPDQVHRLPTLIEEVISCRGAGAETTVESTELVNDYYNYHFVFNSPSAERNQTISEFVTVMKGCNNFCSFCIVPHVRGREVSKSAGDVISEIRNLTESGVKEVTLLGQNVNSYQDFPTLLSQIAEETLIERIRYTSPHPKDLSSELIAAHQTNPKLCEHIHLPVQAGSSNVLDRMNRRYTREDYIALVQKIRQAVPQIAITTDLMVGFSGESDSDFEQTIELMKEIEFDGMFAFKYSVRPGTSAAEKYKDDVSDAIKKARLAKVLELNQKIVLQKHRKYVGTKQEVLVEGGSVKFENQLTGRTRTNKVVNFDGDRSLVGSLAKVEITWAGPNTLKGKLTI